MLKICNFLRYLKVDPLLNYQIKTSDAFSRLSVNPEEYYYTNSLIKFISDLFSTNQTKNSTSIFYLSDYNVLIDIIIRKLSNLSANDQVIMTKKFFLLILSEITN